MVFDQVGIFIKPHLLWMQVAVHDFVELTL